MADTERLEQAHERAQAAFHDMLENGTQADKDSPFTQAYVAAERVVDEILTDLQWEAGKAAMDRLQDADMRPCPSCGVVLPPSDTHWNLLAGAWGAYVCPVPDLSLGDHHVGIGR